MQKDKKTMQAKTEIGYPNGGKEIPTPKMGEKMNINKKALGGAIIISAILVVLLFLFSVLPAYNIIKNPPKIGELGQAVDFDSTDRGDDTLAQQVLLVGIGRAIIFFCILTVALYFVIDHLIKKKKK